MAHDEKLIDAIKVVIEHPSGIGLELFMIGESSPDADFVRFTLKVLNDTGDLSK